MTHFIQASLKEFHHWPAVFHKKAVNMPPQKEAYTTESSLIESAISADTRVSVGRAFGVRVMGKELSQNSSCLGAATVCNRDFGSPSNVAIATIPELIKNRRADWWECISHEASCNSEWNLDDEGTILIPLTDTVL